MTERGIKTRPLAGSVNETIDKLEAFIKKNGATVYARIDQQAELAKAGLSIPPLEFILFGNPAAGGKLMVSNPVVALDLPLKFIAWQDDKAKTWLAYNEAGYIIYRYGLDADTGSILNLDKMVDKALNIQ